jgi:hypothetical protein
MNVAEALDADLAALPEALRVSGLAGAARRMAAAIDEGPADSALPLLVRELRLTLSELRALARTTGGGELDDFLARISAPDVDYAVGVKSPTTSGEREDAPGARSRRVAHPFGLI